MLPMMRRLIIVILVLSLIYIYLMTNLVIHINVILKLEAMVKNFLWGSLDTSKKVHLLYWNRVC